MKTEPVADGNGHGGVVRRHRVDPHVEQSLHGIGIVHRPRADPDPVPVRRFDEPYIVDGYHLVVMGPDEFASHPLPATGDIIIGRGAGVEVSLGAPARDLL